MYKFLSLILALVICSAYSSQAANMQINPAAKSFKYSTTVEKERPQLSAETQKLIANYRQNPTQSNYNALRNEVAKNYDKVLTKKKAKLVELKQTARDTSKINEMQVIVDEMIRDRDNRINQTMARFTDSRLAPNARNANDGYLPVLGASNNVNIAYTEVTNEQYAQFVKATGRKTPQNWANGTYPNGQGNYPVIYVTYNDAVAYCNWLSKKDHSTTYRLPTEQEWEFAAGHMPKDADFNAGENKGLTPVTFYSQTKSASGAINMWGNVWEWTSTSRNTTDKAVKGGSWNSKRTECRTELRTEGRNQSQGYNNVGFRIIKIK